MKGKRVNVLVCAIIPLLVVAVAVYFVFFYVNTGKYEWWQPIKESISPDGQHKVDAHLLGEIDELAHYIEGIEDPKNDTYDLYVRVWYSPESMGNGSVMWHDTNSRLIYFKADCTKVEITWLDNDTVVINGETLNVDTGLYVKKFG